jgi:hypothetical protein
MTKRSRRQSGKRNEFTEGENYTMNLSRCVYNMAFPFITQYIPHSIHVALEETSKLFLNLRRILVFVLK